MEPSKFVLLAAAFVVTTPCWADHPDAAHSPRGRAEDALSGVYINAHRDQSILNNVGLYIEPMAAVLTTLGKPDSVVAVPKSNSCESNYLWTIRSVRLEVRSGGLFQTVEGKDVMRTNGAFSIEVWGHHAVEVGVTGRGLALGDPWSKVMRLYGSRCECGWYTSGTGTQDTHGLKYVRYATYIWDEVGNELDIDLDARGRVVHMLLMADQE